ncbi:MAG: zeta toxin family protein [bacterium]|nr:zeta toxin family protein [bacterium]
MTLSDEEKLIQQEACQYIKEHEAELIEKFITSKKPLPLGFATIFMAGSPGAGKTEFSRRYIPLLVDKGDTRLQEHFKKRGADINDFEALLVIIDVDEIRGFLPQYRKTDVTTGQKGNSHVVQKAAGKGLDILREHCLKNEISFLHDGTFGNFDTMRDLVRKSIAGGRQVHIFYIYLDPLSAWEFTKAREALEGRNIVKEKFIEQYIQSRKNVDAIKQEFGEKIRLNVILKNSKNEVEDIQLNVPSLDQFLKTQYNKGTVKEYSAEELIEVIK